MDTRILQMGVLATLALASAGTASARNTATDTPAPPTAEETANVTEVTVADGTVMDSVSLGLPAELKDITVRKTGAGMLLVRSAKGPALNNATLEIADGSLQTLRDKDGSFTLADATLRFLKSALWDARFALDDPDFEPWLNIHGRLTVDVAQDATVDCTTRLADCKENGDILKTGSGSLQMALNRTVKLTVKEGTFLIGRAPVAADAEGNSVGEGATVTVEANAAVAAGPAFVAQKLNLVFRNGAKLRLTDKVLTLKPDATVTAEGPIVPDGLPEQPAEGTPLLTCPTEGLTFALPESYAEYSVLRNRYTGTYEIRRDVQAEKTLTDDEGWSPEVPRYTKATVTLDGHSLLLKAPLKTDVLIVNGSGTIDFWPNSDASLEATHIIARGGTVTLPESAVRNARHIEIHPQTVVQTFTTADLALVNTQISGPVADDGTVSPGGKFRTSGVRLLIYGSHLHPFDIDRATVEIAGGDFWAGYSGDGRSFAVRDAEIRFVEGASGKWDWNGGVYSGEGTMTVYVGAGKSVYHNLWWDIDTVKTGPGALRFCQGKGHRGTIAEGIWNMPGGGDSNSGSPITVKKGAIARRSEKWSFASPVIFEPGAKVRCRGWENSPVKVHGPGRIIATEPIEVDGLPQQPDDDLIILESDDGSHTFNLGPGYEEYAVYYDAPYYKTYKAAEETVTLADADGEWTPTAKRYRHLTLNPNGKTLTVTGTLAAEKVSVVGSGTVKIAAGVGVSVRTLHAGSSVTLGPELLDGVRHLEIAPEAVVTLREDAPEPPADTAPEEPKAFAGELSRHVWNGCITGPRAEDGTILPGGTFRKEGSMGLALKGVQWHENTLDRVTLEIAGGSLGTYCGDREFKAQSSVIRFCEQADSTWDFTSGRMVRLVGGTRVEVGEGLDVRCNSWIVCNSEKDRVVKAGPGRLDLPMYDGFHAFVEEGPWVLTDSSNCRSGALLTVGPKGWITRRADADAFASPIEMQPGAKILYSETTPVKMADGIGIRAAQPIEMMNLPPAKNLYRNSAALIETTQDSLAFALPDGYDDIGVLFDGSRYVAKFVQESETVSLNRDTSWNNPPPYRNLTVDLRGHTLTVSCETILETLTLKGSGRVVLVPGKPAEGSGTGGTGGSLNVGRLIVADPGAEVAVSPSAIGSETDTDGYPTRVCPKIEIAAGARLVVDSEKPLFYRGSVSGILNAEGIPSAGGTLVKNGSGTLALSPISAETYLLDHASVSVAGGELKTLHSSLHYFRNAGIAFRGAAEGQQKWHHTQGCQMEVTGTLTVNVDVGRNIWIDAWIINGKLIKTGAGKLSYCNASTLTSEVREGTWLVDAGDSEAGSVVTVMNGAAVEWPENRPFAGQINFEPGAKIRFTEGVLPYASGPVAAKGPLLIEGLPADAADGTQLLRTGRIGLAFGLPAGKTAVYNNGIYELCTASEAEKTLTADETWTPERPFYTRLTLRGSGTEVLTVAGAIAADLLVLDGVGEIRLAENASVKATRVIANTSVRIPTEMLLPTKQLEIAASQTVTFANGTDIAWEGCVTGPVAPGSTVVLPGGTLRKEGAGRLELRGVAARTYALDSVTLDIAGGWLYTVKDSRPFSANRAAIRFIEDMAFPDSARAWQHYGEVVSPGTLKVHVGDVKQIVFCDAWMAADIVKSGPGTFGFALDTNRSAVIEEGLWQMPGGGEAERGKMITVKSGAVALRKPGSWSFRTPLTLGDGAKLRYSDAAPIHLNSRAVITAPGSVLMDGLPETPTADLTLLITPQAGVPIVLPEAYTQAGLTVAYVDGAYRTCKKEIPGEDIVITPPSEDDPVIPGSALETWLKAAAKAEEGVTKVVLKSGNGNGKPLSVSQMDSAVAVFANAAVTQKEGDTLTVTVGYTFAVTDIRIDAANGSAVLTVSATDADGKPLTLAEGAAVRILKDTRPLGDALPLNADGTAEFTLTLEPSAPDIRAEAFKE